MAGACWVHRFQTCAPGNLSMDSLTSIPIYSMGKRCAYPAPTFKKRAPGDGNVFCFFYRKRND